MAVSCQQILEELRAFAPPRFALDRDPTGLQVGHADKTVERVLCCLDLTLAVAEEARDLGAGLVVSHHAVIFRPLKDLRTDRPRGQLLALLLQHDIAVYVPHTALDVTDGGLNDHLATIVGLQATSFLERTGNDEAVLIALDGLDDDKQTQGAQLLEGFEARAIWPTPSGLRAALPERRLAAALRRIERDLHVTGRSSRLLSQGAPRGIGRVGLLPAPETVEGLAQRVVAEIGAPFARVVADDPRRELRKVAVLCGDGRSFLDAATFAGADALVTGDVDHHTALEARARGIALIDVGHWASERSAGAILAAALRERLTGKAVEVSASEVVTQPFTLVGPSDSPPKMAT